MRIRLWAAGRVVLLLSCASNVGCSVVETRTELPRKIYHAYGKTWEYHQIEIRSTNPFLASLHMGGNGYREEHYIREIPSQAGTFETLVNDKLYALQKNGRYKKIVCCEYFREQAELYNFDDKLVLEFANARKFITDCFIYPGGHPDNEKKPEGQQIFGSTVYGEFDPSQRIFIVNSFDAGKFSEDDYKAAGAGRSIESHALFMYEHRVPFQCDQTPTE